MQLTIFICVGIVLLLKAMELAAKTDACPNCGETISDQYNAQKASITDLMKIGQSEFVFIENFKALVDANKQILSQPDQTTIYGWLQMVENDIIEDAAEKTLGEENLQELMARENVPQNGSFATPSEKVLGVAMKLDQLFVQYPSIANALKYKMLGTWGPLLHFIHIANEMNIPEFIVLTSTRLQRKQQCLISLLLQMSAVENGPVISSLKYDAVPCTLSYKTFERFTNMHNDMYYVKDRLTFKSLQIINSHMTVNQLQAIARMYYSSKAYSCRRLKDMFAGYAALNLNNKVKSRFEQYIWDRVAAGIPAGSSTEYCIDWWSSTIANFIEKAPTDFKYLDEIFWNRPFGSFYENIIIAGCQMDALKENAPEYYK